MNIRQIRKRLGLKPDEVARALGVSWRTLLRWELGQSSPTGANLAALLALFQSHDVTIQLADLLTQSQDAA